MSKKNVGETKEAQFVLFGVNMGNVGQTGPRVKMTDQCNRWNSVLCQLEPPLSICATYRHTGNFMLAARASVDAQRVSRHLSDVLGITFAVFTAENFLEWLRQVEIAVKNEPFAPKGRRPTPGVVMDTNTNPQAGMPPRPVSNECMAFGSQVLPRVQVVWKFDLLAADGRTLDRNRREGGWGAVATAIQQQYGGIWTARALSTVKGLSRWLGNAPPA